MIRNILYLIQFSILIIISGCSSGEVATSPPFKFGFGEYNFTMSDSSGKALLKGIINVTGVSDDKISGVYTFKNVYDYDFPGLSSMDGNFEGNIIQSEKKVFINTNPGIADSNVFWNLEMKKKYLEGEWTFSVFRGSMNKGKIKITK